MKKKPQHVDRYVFALSAVNNKDTRQLLNLQAVYSSSKAPSGDMVTFS